MKNLKPNYGFDTTVFPFRDFQQVLGIGSLVSTICFHCRPSARKIYQTIPAIYREYYSSLLASKKVKDETLWVRDCKEKIPCTSTKKADIISWLQSKGVTVDNTYVKAELLNLVKGVNAEEVYVVDEMAEEKGIKVLRLPPYHCTLNPYELVWADVKGYAARNNLTYIMAKAKELLLEALNQVTPEKWKKCVDHVQCACSV